MRLFRSQQEPVTFNVEHKTMMSWIKTDLLNAWPCSSMPDPALPCLTRPAISLDPVLAGKYTGTTQEIFASILETGPYERRNGTYHSR